MNNDEITKRIYEKSDNELRKKLDGSIKWVWDETGHSVSKPDSADEINHALNGTSLPAFKDVPWIGAIQKQYVEVAFAYLKDNYRNKALTDFMQKVEAINSIIES